MKITMDDWVAAVTGLLGRFTETDETTDDGATVTRKRHETDPPDGFRPPRGMRRPGPLPELVAEKEIAKGARTQVHDHAVPEGDDVLDHMARVVVLEARRIQASGVALREPAEKDGRWTLSVVNVL